MVYFLLSLLIFLIPFIINPFFGYFFEPPKVIFAEILIELLLFIFLFKKGFFHSLNKYQLILSAILSLLTLTHLILNPSLYTFFGNEFRLQGIFLLWHLLVLSLLSSRMNITELPKVLFPICLFLLALTSFLVSPDLNGRAVGTLGEANALASSAIFFFPFAFILNLNNKFKDRAFKMMILLTVLVIILLSGSRSGMLAYLIQIGFLIFVKWKISIKKAVSLSFLFILLTLFLPLIKGGGWFENRSEIWKTSFYSGSQSILGNGFGNIEQALYESSEKINNNTRFQSVDSSHNFLLDFWVQGGVIGLGVIILLVILSLKSMVKNQKVVEVTTFLGLICVLLFNPASVATLVSFWFILGQGFKEDV